MPIRYSRAVLWLSLLITLVLSLFLPRLHVSTDRNLLAGKNNPAFERRDEVNRIFGTSLVSVAVIEGDTQQQANAAAVVLAERLKQNKRHVRNVFYRAETEFFEKHALLFAPVSVLEGLPKWLNTEKLNLTPLEESNSLSQLVLAGASFLRTQPVSDDTSHMEVIQGTRTMEELLLATEKWFEDPTVQSLEPVARWEHAVSQQLGLPLAIDKDGFFTANDSKSPYLAIAFIQPASDSQAMEVVAPLTDFIRHTASQVARENKLNIIVSGMPSLATDELRLVSHDCVIAGIIAGVGVLLVFLLAFRSLRVSLFLVLPLGAGLIWAAGFTALVYAHLTMITSYFAAVLFGLGVAFTIHIVARFHEALRCGETKEAAIASALIGAGPGVITGGMTTAVAFLAIVFSEFQGFAEMGVISGVGVILILVANLTLLPAALLHWHPGVSAVHRSPRTFRIKQIPRLPGMILLLSGLGLFVAGVVFAPKVRFNYAVESMLPSTSSAVKGIRIMNERTAFSSTFSVATTHSLEDAARLAARFRRLSTVSRVESAASFIPCNQSQKQRVLKQISPRIGDALLRISHHWQSLDSEQSVESQAELASAFEELQFTLSDLAFDAQRANRSEAKLLQRLAAITTKVHVSILKSNENRVREFEKYIYQLLARGTGVLANGLYAKGIGISDLPDTIRRRFVSGDGRQFAVVVYPAGDIGNKNFFYKHVDELLSVDPNITGHPVTHRAFTEMIQKGFIQAVILSTIAVFFLVLLDLRNPASLLLALGPVFLAAGWTSLAMYISGLQFNYANLMGVPILIGTAVDYGVHLAHRVRQDGSVPLALQTTGKAILLSGVTTLIGFGSLLAGNHWGVKSLGILLVTGIFFALVAAMTVIPMFFILRRKSDNHD